MMKFNLNHNLLSFLFGAVIVVLTIFYIQPVTSYSQAMSILDEFGQTATDDGILIYKPDEYMLTLRETHALAKLSNVHDFVFVKSYECNIEVIDGIIIKQPLIE